MQQVQHMMPLGLVLGVRTQGQGWPFQEVHHCATHVMVAYCEKKCPYIYGLNDEAANRHRAMYLFRSKIPFTGYISRHMYQC